MALVQIPAPVAGANWTVLNSGGTSLSGAQTVTVSGISGANQILVVLLNASSVNASSFINVRLNNDASALYRYSGIEFQNPASYSVDIFGPNGGGGNAGIFVGRMSTNAASQVFGYCLVSGANSSGFKAYTAAGTGGSTGGNTASATNIGGVYESSNLITSVSINSSVGNFDNGSVWVYTSA